jgi:hypothetical protein
MTWFVNGILLVLGAWLAFVGLWIAGWISVVILMVFCGAFYRSKK